MAKESAGKVQVDLELNNKNYNKQLNSSLKGTENAFSSSMKKIGGFIAGVFAVKQIASFTKSCIDSASKVQSAFTGLNSIVQGTGNSFSQAQKFVEEYTKDGLVSIEETATAYKNLLARGYDTSQIEDVMTRLKDSAAFGRQASYDLGEAVVSATEGLKNENSILVDNAGVTKNVAKMWEEYAKAHNTTTSAMTQAQKIEAEYNGIMQETRFQVGDATAYTRTFGGQIQQLKFNFNQMTVAIGKVVAPIAQLFIPIINSAMSAVTNFFTKIQGILKVFGLEMPNVVSKASSSMSNLGGSAVDTASDIASTGTAAKKAAKEVNRAFAGVDEINVLNTQKSASGDSSSTSSNIPNMEIDTGALEKSTSIFDKLLKKTSKIQDALASIWNSKPIKAYRNLIETEFDFIKKLTVQLGKDLWSNMSLTWNNIKDNVGVTLSNISLLFTNMWTDMANGIQTWGQPIINNISGLFNSIWSTAIDPAIQLITQSWADFSGTLVDLWNEHGQPLVDNIGEFVNKVIGLFQKIWDDILEPIITPFLETLSWLWEEHISKMVEKVGDFIGKLVNGALEIYNKFVDPIVKFLMDVFAPVWSRVSSTIIGVIGTIIGFLSDSVGNAMEYLGGIIDFVTGVFTLNWDKAWNGVKNIFKSIFDSLATIFKVPINLIIDGINGFISGLNKIKIPDWVPGVGGKGFNIKKIPKLEEGGWIPRNEPQLAIVGDNTREPEIVTPESKIYDQVDRAIKANNGTNKQEIELTLNVKYEDGRKIIKKINQAEIEAGEILLLV